MQAINEEFDAIVVGTGPGGATVAKELALRRKKVLILEWGSDAPLKGTNIQAGKIGGIPGKGFLLTHNFLGVFRGIASGGSSTLFYATAFDPPVELFNKYGIDISREIDEIREEYPVGVLSDDLIGPMAKRLMESGRDLGYDWNKLQKFIYQDKCRTDCWRCNYGCPYGAKWSGRMSVEDAILSNASLITEAKVKKVLIENNKAVGVEYRKGGTAYKVMAPLVIISAGGIGSPVILNASGIKNTGKDFFFDPLITVMGAAKDIKGGKEIPMAAGIHMEEEGYLMTDMTIPRTLYMGFAAEVFRLHKLFSHSKILTIMIKAKDELGGSITSNGGVRKRLSKNDLGKLQKGQERAEKILKNAGAKGIFKSWYLASHPGGTVKINEIVNSDLKSEVDNLYVCDCSVIPESWGLPPTFSLIALGKRLAKHLAD
ncbi:GMC family oxidoreductase [bacterium]|nr:GMC family oxidoreductase [bacterium]